MKRKLIYIIGSSVVAGSLVFGTVLSVEGTRLLVSDRGGRAGTTHEIDASDAVITQGYGMGAPALTVNNIAAGDTVMVLNA